MSSAPADISHRLQMSAASVEAACLSFAPSARLLSKKYTTKAQFAGLQDEYGAGARPGDLHEGPAGQAVARTRGGGSGDPGVGAFGTALRPESAQGALERVRRMLP